MKRFHCLTVVLIFLMVTFCISTAAIAAPGFVSYIINTDENVTATVEGQGITFIATETDIAVNIDIQMKDKRITFERSKGPANSQISLGSHLNNETNPTVLSDNDYQDIENLFVLVRQSPPKSNEQAKNIGLLLNLLSSWPKVMPVYAVIDSENTTAID
ncbi:MAG: hypothetical protein HQL08_04515 [Nitrospirae bacterium]|nr:hypothetical protein [Nitrospirota bacterium]